ncbi:type VI secretion system protein TssA [Pontivivens ytuae]|uniref:Type VI secretion system protein TssA n=1 Tax=Pontivivens ytuae TaxID=2789856 RepID=A0A7S9QD71_9RHOB|nr:type VI secretion system protein TssA [Pontivivens ytuae]QPH54082.1 type VI secretion system protein TssA [Pontivivens ytuae]
MLDLQSLLNDLQDDAPSGEDLEYDPDFMALELASQPGEERVVGDAVIPAEDPDYPAVVEGATALLGRTRDLRVAVILATAALRTGGLPAFEQVLDYMRRALEDHWESVHPQLDAEDDDDPTARVNAVLGLTSRTTVLQALREAKLTQSRAMGQFSLRDLLIAEGEVAPAEEEEAPGAQTIEAAFRDTDPDHLAALASAVAASQAHVAAISTAIDTRIGTAGPDLDLLTRMLREIARRISPYVAQDVETAETTADDTPAPAPQATPTAVSGTGAIASPEDVKAAIDRIVAYYEQVEPSSPVPMLLARARRLVSADFVTIMRDMAPAGVENVALIGGFSEDENSYD